MTAFFVSIDPGLDRAAAAIWRVDGWREPALALDLAARAERLVAVEQCVTHTEDTLAVRLGQLGLWARAAITRAWWSPELTSVTVLVELPAFTGNYAGRTVQRSRNVLVTGEAIQKLTLATGAIVAGCSSWADVVSLEPAAKLDRGVKQELGRKALALVAARIPGLPNNDDVRSAVYLGLAAPWPQAVAA